MAAHNNGNLYADLVPADERVEAVSGTQELAGGCLDGRVVDLRSQVLEQLNTNLLFNSSMAGATGSVLPTNWASGSVSGLTYTISSASTVQGLRSIEWTVSGTALSDGDLWLACEPMVSGSVVAQIPSEYVGSMYCAKVSGTIKAGMVLQTLTQNFINGAVQETKTKDLAAVTGQTFVRIEPNSVKTDVDLENRVNLRLYQSIASGEVIDFTIRVAAPQVEAGVTASPFISTVSGAVSEVRGRPSILVVPQLTKAGTVYPQLPTVSGADFTVSRNTTATRVNSSGLIESVASGVPRIDWLGQSCPGLLVEPSAQNLAVQSEAWVSGNNWALTNITTATGAIAAPNGTITANALSPTAVSGGHFVFSNGTTTVSYTSGTIYTQSAFFKAGTGAAGQFVQLTFPSARFTQLGYANFDLIAGTVSVVSGSSADANRAARIESYGDGWYRCIFTATCNSTDTGAGLIIPLITSTGSGRLPSFTGVTGNVLYGWGAQLETGSIASTYIPTTTAAVSRAADVISAPGALVSSLIGQTEGTIYAEVDIRNAFAGTFISLDIGSTADFLIIGRTSSFAVIVQIKKSSGSTVTIITSSAVALGVHKIALGYTNGDYALYIDGVSAGTSTNSTDYPSAALTRCNLAVTAYNVFNDRIRAAALYTTRLSNAQLAELTRL